jgi:hypothetical protein
MAYFPPNNPASTRPPFPASLISLYGQQSNPPGDASQESADRLMSDAKNAATLPFKLSLINSEALHRIAWHRSHYDPNQPRVPAGNPRGGQWTDQGHDGANSGTASERSHLTLSSSVDQVRSDARADPIRVWSQYAQIESDNSAQDPAIENTRQVLHDLLSQVNASVSTRRDPLSARLYGVIVHAEFAKAVRAKNLPGIGQVGVEQSFDVDGLARYGLDGSIRTDIVVRNTQGQIIAIFDVKTGNATLSSTREAKIRAFTRVGYDVPVIILRAMRGHR